MKNTNVLALVGAPTEKLIAGLAAAPNSGVRAESSNPDGSWNLLQIGLPCPVHHGSCIAHVALCNSDDACTDSVWCDSAEDEDGALRRSLTQIAQIGLEAIDSLEPRKIRVHRKTGEIAAINSTNESERADTTLTKPGTTRPSRKLVLTAASAIKPRPVRWLWEGRQAIGSLGLIAGGEGLGKSTLAYTVAAQVTRGELPGAFEGVPKAVLIAATEDSWSHTIVTRLIAAGADLDRVHRVEVLNAENITVGLRLPSDNRELHQAALQTDAALLILDPLMSRLGELDTHKDAEVRQALEPLVAVADSAHLAVIGLIHHNKGGSSDPLQLVMGSKAFTAVARAVHTVIRDPDDEDRRLFGTPKNNLGRSDLPTLPFTIESFAVPTDEGTAYTGKLIWGEPRNETVTSILERAESKKRGVQYTTRKEAHGWLEEHLTAADEPLPSSTVKAEGEAAGFNPRTISRAASELGVIVEQEGFPRRTLWSMPERSDHGASG